jgi:hypothetical protein
MTLRRTCDSQSRAAFFPGRILNWRGSGIWDQDCPHSGHFSQNHCVRVITAIRPQRWRIRGSTSVWETVLGSFPPSGASLSRVTPRNNDRNKIILRSKVLCVIPSLNIALDVDSLWLIRGGLIQISAIAVDSWVWMTRPDFGWLCGSIT